MSDPSDDVSSLAAQRQVPQIESAKPEASDDVKPDTLDTQPASQTKEGPAWGFDRSILARKLQKDQKDSRKTKKSSSSSSTSSGKKKKKRTDMIACKVAIFYFSLPFSFSL